ncbi:hypothetical protein L3V83_01280 [Thiotrichales bacterium 19X7-9]|nr:hypothetical protein [Thiotrichales bacterium 19X7-9]
MNQKRVNKWAFVSFILGVILTIVSMLLIHSAYGGELYSRIHWLVTLIVAIPWVIFIICLFIMLFADKS